MDDQKPDRVEVADSEGGTAGRESSEGSAASRPVIWSIGKWIGGVGLFLVGWSALTVDGYLADRIGGLLGLLASVGTLLVARWMGWRSWSRIRSGFAVLGIAAVAGLVLLLAAAVVLGPRDPVLFTTSGSGGVIWSALFAVLLWLGTTATAVSEKSQ